MKTIHVRVVSIILLSLLLVYGAFLSSMLIIMPRHFIAEAEKALAYEIDYMTACAEVANEGNYDAYPDYEGTYFSGNINYIDLFADSATADEDIPYVDSAETDGTVSSTEEADSTSGTAVYAYGGVSDLGSYRVSKDVSDQEVRLYHEENPIPSGQFRSFRTKDGYYAVTYYRESLFSSADYIGSLMYINIAPLLQYLNYLIVIVSIVFLVVAIGMSVLGWILGRKVEKEQEEKQHFFQNSSHELKTPLMAIQGYAEGISTGITDASTGADVILQESDKMSLLVEELLTISKLDAHAYQLNCNNCDIRELLYDCMLALEPIQKEKNIQITHLFPDTPVLLYGDEEKLTRVFKNVLLNGITHSKQTVVITCKQEGNNAIVQIKDDGPGLAPEDLPHIFDRFFTGKNGNTGIGLALAKEFVQLHKGKITAYNDVGAVFEITLPCNQKGAHKKEKEQRK